MSAAPTTKRKPTAKRKATTKREPEGGAKLLIDLGPLLIFFLANFLAPVPDVARIFVATGAFIVAMVAAAEKFGLPIHAIGIGEGVDDLRPFDPRAVARAIAGLAE